MYDVNIPCSFRTEHGSRYVIHERLVIRYKFDGTHHENPKNIYYANLETKNTCVQHHHECSSYRVDHISEVQASITFFNEDGVRIGTCVVERYVTRGHYPIDMMLSEEGIGVKGRDRFHHGHTITEIL